MRVHLAHVGVVVDDVQPGACGQITDLPLGERMEDRRKARSMTCEARISLAPNSPRGLPIAGQGSWAPTWAVDGGPCLSWAFRRPFGPPGLPHAAPTIPHLAP